MHASTCASADAGKRLQAAGSTMLHHAVPLLTLFLMPLPAHPLGQCAQAARRASLAVEAPEVPPGASAPQGPCHTNSTKHCD